MYKIEFSDGTVIKVKKLYENFFTSLQEKHKMAIVRIDGQDACYYGMTKQEIEKEQARIARLQYQAKCKHDRGYITNTGKGVGSKCIICGKEMT